MRAQIGRRGCEKCKPMQEQYRSCTKTDYQEVKFSKIVWFFKIVCLGKNARHFLSTCPVPVAMGWCLWRFVIHHCMDLVCRELWIIAENNVICCNRRIIIKKCATRKITQKMLLASIFHCTETSVISSNSDEFSCQRSEHGHCNATTHAAWSGDQGFNLKGETPFIYLHRNWCCSFEQIAE